MSVEDVNLHAPVGREERDAGDGRLSGVVAVIIAFATLVAAMAGFLQADASNRATDLRAAAEQLSLRALAGSQSAQQSAQVELETFARWVEQRTRAGNALLASLYAGSDPARAEALQREQQPPTYHVPRITVGLDPAPRRAQRQRQGAPVFLLRLLGAG